MKRRFNYIRVLYVWERPLCFDPLRFIPGLTIWLPLLLLKTTFWFSYQSVKKWLFFVTVGAVRDVRLARNLFCSPSARSAPRAKCFPSPTTLLKKKGAKKKSGQPRPGNGRAAHLPSPDWPLSRLTLSKRCPGGSSWSVHAFDILLLRFVRNGSLMGLFSCSVWNSWFWCKNFVVFFVFLFCFLCVCVCVCV